jgi:hypothetical protein
MGRIRDRDGRLHPRALGACGRFWQGLRSNGRTFRTNTRHADAMPRHRRINGSRAAPVSLPSSTSFEPPGENRGGGLGPMEMSSLSIGRRHPAVRSRIEVRRQGHRPQDGAQVAVALLAEGSAGLADRSSRPHRSPTVIARGTAQRVISLRRHRHAMRSIAQTLGIATAVVSRVPARAGFSRLAAPDVPPAPNRYERVDCAAGFLAHALAYYGSLGHRAGPDRQRQGIRFRAVRSPM